MPSLLISGAGRGLGLEFVRQYAAEGWRVYATIRDPDRADALKAIGGDVSIHPLEVTDKASLDALSLALRTVPLDLVIANAGVIGPRGMAPETIDRESWLETFAVNTLAPVALAGAFKHNLDKGKQRRLVAISSKLGSIASNESGSLYAYRSSKAALNAAWRSIALDWKPAGIHCAVLHPGWVRTDMGGAGADLAPEDSVAGMRRVIAGLGAAESGGFFNYDGAVLPW